MASPSKKGVGFAVMDDEAEARRRTLSAQSSGAFFDALDTEPDVISPPPPALLPCPPSAPVPRDSEHSGSSGEPRERLVSTTSTILSAALHNLLDPRPDIADAAQREPPALRAVRSDRMADEFSAPVSAAFAAFVASMVAGYVWTNLSTGTYTRLLVYLGDARDLIVDQVIFTFTSFGSVHLFWQSDARATAILTGVCGGAMPYAFTLAFLGVWFARQCPLRRGFVIAFLMQTTKWTRMLTFAAVLLCLGLKTDARLSDLNAKVELRTVLSYGNFSFEATCVGAFLVMAFLSFCHHLMHPAPTALDLAAHRGDTAPRAFASRVLDAAARRQRALALVGVVANAALLPFSLSLEIIRFTVRYNAGHYVKRPVIAFSTWQMMTHVHTSTLGEGSQVAFTAFLAVLCVALPVAAALGMLALWSLPLRPRAQQLLFDVVRHAQAWSSIEVLWVVLSNFATQVSLISVWIVNDTAEQACDAIADLTGTDGCYEVTGKPLLGFYVLALALALQNALFFYTGSLVHRPELLKLIANVRKAKVADGARSHDRPYELMLEGDVTEV